MKASLRRLPPLVHQPSRRMYGPVGLEVHNLLPQKRNRCRQIHTGKFLGTEIGVIILERLVGPFRTIANVHVTFCCAAVNRPVMLQLAEPSPTTAITDRLPNATPTPTAAGKAKPSVPAA